MARAHDLAKADVASDAASSDEYYRKGWTDGLPIVPPTKERVESMLASVGLPAGHVLGLIGPRRGRATVEKVAVNAVMAGCLPEHLPVVAAAIEAVAYPDFQMDRIGPWTAPAAPLLAVNGPIVTRIGLNTGYDLFGGGNQANATIGRAVRLILQNIGGVSAGAVIKSPHGQPGRQGMCIGEDEGASPWDPYHVEQGHAGSESTVTALAVTGTAPIFYRVQRHLEKAEDLVDVISACLRYVEGYAKAYHQDGGLPALVLCPAHARTFSDAGWSKDDVRAALAARVDFSPVYGEEARLNAPTCIMPGQADERISRLPVLVAGGVAGFHSTFLPTIVGVPPVTRVVPD